MSGWKKGVILGVVHLLMVASLGAKLVYDRATRPRAWARVVPYDPNLPIRGRYVSLQMEVLAPGLQSPDNPLHRLLNFSPGLCVLMGKAAQRRHHEDIYHRLSSRRPCSPRPYARHPTAARWTSLRYSRRGRAVVHRCHDRPL